MHPEENTPTIQIQVENVERVVSQFDYKDQNQNSGQLAEGGSGESSTDGEGKE